MLVTESGIATLVNPLQPENAPSPMLVTLSGIVTLVNPLQYQNAEPAMPRTPVRSKSPDGELLPTTQPSTNLTPGIVVVS